MIQTLERDHLKMGRTRFTDRQLLATATAMAPCIAAAAV